MSRTDGMPKHQGTWEDYVDSSPLVLLGGSTVRMKGLTPAQAVCVFEDARITFRQPNYHKMSFHPSIMVLNTTTLLGPRDPLLQITNNNT